MGTITIDLLNAVKATTETQSDYAAARALNITRQAVSGYRAGNRQMDEEPAIRAAEILGIDPVQVLATLNYEKAKSEKMRNIWWRVREMAKTAACILLTAGALNLALSPAQQAVAAAGGAAHCILCQMRKRQRRHRLATVPQACDATVTYMRYGFASN